MRAPTIKTIMASAERPDACEPTQFAQQHAAAGDHQGGDRKPTLTPADLLLDQLRVRFADDDAERTVNSWIEEDRIERDLQHSNRFPHLGASLYAVMTL